VDVAEGTIGTAQAVDERERPRQAEARLAAFEAVQALERRAVLVVRDQGR
jgi:hypothetical protein